MTRKQKAEKQKAALEYLDSELGDAPLFYALQITGKYDLNGNFYRYWRALAYDVKYNEILDFTPWVAEALDLRISHSPTYCIRATDPIAGHLDTLGKMLGKTIRYRVGD